MKKYKYDEVDYGIQKIVEPYMDVFHSMEPDVEIYEANEYIVRYNEPIQKLRYLVSGKAKITMIHEDGNQTIVYFIRPEEYIGELTFIDIEKEPKNVIAIGECICLSVPMNEAIQELIHDDKFLLRLNRYVGMKLLDRTWFSSKNQNYELKNRLAAYMLMMENNGIYKVKHTETAEYLGVSYRHLLHTIRILKDEGVIEKYQQGYKLNIQDLKVLAKDIEIL